MLRIFNINIMKTLHLLFLFIFLTHLSYSQKSSATLRLEQHALNNNCDVTIPNNPDWNIAFERSNLTGDLAPNVTYIRRDPSSVLKVDGKYYVWYSYSLTNGAGKIAPWDLNDLYYASSSDGHNWEEHGLAIGRGPVGSFDHRSVFTTEVFFHNNTFYLIYQAAADTEGIFGRNTIGMAHASSPHGPWTKLTSPVLSPTVSTSPAFDKNAVHDPCLIYFKNKFYLYYKGEGDETNVCGLGIWNLDKQVKWGVAVSDSPTGPFVKSEYNPITNTGHEVCVWKSGEGIAIMLHQDGPEFGTIQYAADGINFEIMGKVEDFVRTAPYSTSDYPEAAGVYRPVNDETSPVSGVSWGLCHVLGSSTWMYLKRFESEDKTLIVDDANNNGIELGGLSIKDANASNKLHIYPNPATDIINVTIKKSGDYTYEIRSLTGQIIKKGNYNSNIKGINTSSLNEGFYILILKHTESKNTYQNIFIKSIVK